MADGIIHIANRNSGGKPRMHLFLPVAEKDVEKKLNFSRHNLLNGFCNYGAKQRMQRRETMAGCLRNPESIFNISQ
ncbi:hypothetical protein M513_12840 [Trichuris suis]|uniref:Uncharacterized protein n=1 Tax=Trichuris suis TaxID=68888 RepID=A0A085LMT1_9BILA|nr:hypothetical protein M513_12838 [Trichuris suis]KFD46279.1 hypothetical protein M513_12840 [Trichuris suis]